MPDNTAGQPGAAQWLRAAQALTEGGRAALFQVYWYPSADILPVLDMRA